MLISKTYVLFQTVFGIVMITRGNTFDDVNYYDKKGQK